MRRSAALDVAMTLVEYPAAVRDVRGSPLPAGVGVLLQVAAAEAAALRAAQAMTGRSQATLQAAAGFFIEQILFHPHADYYRVLGVSAGASRSDLRRHMALLIRWLHPDGREHRVSRSDMDRGIFIHRVTQAWENLKSDERRVAYDRTLSETVQQKPQRRSRRGRMPGQSARSERRHSASVGKPDQKRRFPRLIIYSFERESLLRRVFTYLWTRR